MPVSALLLCEDEVELTSTVANGDDKYTVAKGDDGSDAEVLLSEPARRPSPFRRVAVSMVAGGLAILGAAALAPGLGREPRVSVGPPVPTKSAAHPLAITLSGPGDVTVLTQVYEPGGDSGWHAHPGIHAVAVLSGTLTIYDENCKAESFGPGQSYVGGQRTHQVRNETGAPVEMVVTYLNPAGPHDSNRRVDVPASCSSR